MAKLLNYPLLSYSDYEKTNHTLPVFRKFDSNNRSLLYCGINHTFDPVDPVFIELNNRLYDYKPDLVMLEGSTKINSNHPKRKKYFESIARASVIDLIKEKGEFGYTLKYALENNIEVFCPEPEFKDQINHLLQLYGPEQVFVSKILEMAVQFYTMNDGADIETYLTEEIQWQESEFSLDVNWNKFVFTWENFLQLFKSQFKKSFLECSPDFISEINDPIPWSTKIYAWTINNQISQDECNFRDNFILNQIEQMSKNYKRIMIVYGGSHYYAQEQGLNQIYNN